MDYDVTPLFRSAIGFDRLMHIAGANASTQGSGSYPPYNIEKTSDTDYTLTMALAGFDPQDVSLTLEDTMLVVRGRAPDQGRRRKWLHRGIATRAFERRFALADHIEIHNAHLENGLLCVSIRRHLPEPPAPRPIPIHTAPRVAPSPENAAASDPHTASPLVV